MTPTIGAPGYIFTDPVSGRTCTLFLEGKRDDARPLWTVGIEHPDCAELADVYPDLDCFTCRACGWNGRVAGQWVLSLWSSR